MLTCNQVRAYVYIGRVKYPAASRVAFAWRWQLMQRATRDAGRCIALLLLLIFLFADLLGFAGVFDA